MAVRYNPNPARITEPLYQVKELEKSPLYTVLCGGKELTVYHTDSFDYVIPVSYTHLDVYKRQAVGLVT